MRRDILTFISVIMFLCYGGFVYGDDIIIENGDKLTGTVVRVEKGVLTFRTEYSKPMSIKTSTIKAIQTDQPVEVHLTTEEILKGRLKTDEEGQVIVEAEVGREPVIIYWDKVRAINPPPMKWRGNVTVGVNEQKGNTNRLNASIGAEGERRGKRTRFGLRFLFNYAEEDDEITARNTFGNLKYDYFMTKRLYSFLSIEMLADKFRDLNLRNVVGPGVGYQFWDDEEKSLNLELGVSYFSEDRIVAEDEDWITGRVASSFSWTFFDVLIFSDKAVYYPSIERSSDYQIRNEASLTTALSQTWALKLTHILEHDSAPPEDVRNNDVYWILSLQYSF